MALFPVFLFYHVVACNLTGLTCLGGHQPLLVLKRPFDLRIKTLSFVLSWILGGGNHCSKGYTARSEGDLETSMRSTSGSVAGKPWRRGCTRIKSPRPIHNQKLHGNMWYKRQLRERNANFLKAPTYVKWYGRTIGGSWEIGTGLGIFEVEIAGGLEPFLSLHGTHLEARTVVQGSKRLLRMMDSRVTRNTPIVAGEIKAMPWIGIFTFMSIQPVTNTCQNSPIFLITT